MHICFLVFAYKHLAMAGDDASPCVSLPTAISLTPVNCAFYLPESRFILFYFTFTYSYPAHRRFYFPLSAFRVRGGGSNEAEAETNYFVAVVLEP